MITCNLCGTEKKTRREMHGHLMKMHYQEYKEDSLKGVMQRRRKRSFLQKKKKRQLSGRQGFGC